MKKIPLLFIAMLAIAFTFCSCGNDNDSAVRDKAKQSLPSSPTEAAPAADVTSLPSNNGVAHYICPNNCEGSGGPGSGTCPVCGTEYVHNQAYHNNPAPATDGSTVTPTPTPTAEAPAQNAKGAFHYICEKGCTGGAAGAGTCPTCGGPLTHNAAFHDE